MSKTITITNASKRNIPTALIFTAATSNTAGTKESFVFKFNAADDKSYIVIKNTTAYTVKATLSAGTACTALGSSESVIPAVTTAIIPIESGRISDNNGEITLTLDPGADISLYECGVSVAGFKSGITAY